MRHLFFSQIRMTLVDPETGAAPSMASGMRDLLRDTALFVSHPGLDGAPVSHDAMRKNCIEMIEQFGAALARRGYSSDVQEDAAMAQCALLDETAPRNLSPQDREQWAYQPLQVQKFSQHDAGERVYDRLEARMRESRPQVDLLECYAAVLGLGFKGRYTYGGEGKREAVVVELNELLAQLRSADARPLLTDTSERRLRDRLIRLSPWTIAATGCVIALAVWVLWHLALDVQFAALVSKLVKP